jgi:hypothetical protein
MEFGVRVIIVVSNFCNPIGDTGWASVLAFTLELSRIGSPHTSLTNNDVVINLDSQWSCSGLETVVSLKRCKDSVGVDIVIVKYEPMGNDPALRIDVKSV